jgi:hypothetical protein
LKRYYIIGFILLIAFLLFVAAGSAGADSEVVMGTIGFFGIVALLPLFLYVIIAETRHIEEDIEEEVLDQKEREIPVAAQKAQQQHIEAYETRAPSQIEKTNRESASGIDRGFIEDIRVKQKDKSKGTEKVPGPKTGLLDIPEKVEKVPEPPSESDEQPDGSSKSRLVDIPERADEKPEPEEVSEKQLISGLKADKNRTEDEGVKESEKDEEPKDRLDDSYEEENKNENKTEKEEGD